MCVYNKDFRLVTLYLPILLFLLFQSELRSQAFTDKDYSYYTISDTTALFDPATYTEIFEVLTARIYKSAEILPIWGTCYKIKETARVGCIESQIDFYLMIGVQLFYESFSDETREGTVWTRFYIDKLGVPTILEVTTTLDYHFKKEAMELITGMPRWIPGKINGEEVNVELNMPIRFYRIVKKN